MLELLLPRRPSHKGATIGELLVEGHPQCYTLEDEIREIPGEPVSEWKIPGKTAIPQGRYRIVVTRSNRFSRAASEKAGFKVDVYTPELLNVPGFSGIRIHPLNFATETEGCIGTGSAVGADGASVIGSAIAFNALFTLIKKSIALDEEVWITIMNPTTGDQSAAAGREITAAENLN